MVVERAKCPQCHAPLEPDTERIAVEGYLEIYKPCAYCGLGAVDPNSPVSDLEFAEVKAIVDDLVARAYERPLILQTMQQMLEMIRRARECRRQ